MLEAQAKDLWEVIKSRVWEKQQPKWSKHLKNLVCIFFFSLSVPQEAHGDRGTYWGIPGAWQAARLLS